MLTWGKEYWPIFLTISALWVGLGFGIAEILALFTKSSTHIDNTQSFYARSQLHVSTQLTIHTVAWWASFLVWVVFVFVITLHIWYDQFG
jgi:hypothetical protein